MTPYLSPQSITPDVSTSPKFSDYLVSANEKSAQKDESPAPVESAAVDEKDSEDEDTAAVENEDDENYLAIAQAAVHDTKADTLPPEFDSDGAEEKTVKLSKAAAVQDGADLEAVALTPEIETEAPPPENTLSEEAGAKRRMPNTDKAGASDKADGGDKSGKTESAPEDSDGVKALNASDGIYLDEKNTAAEQLADEVNNGAAEKKYNGFENRTANKPDGHAGESTAAATAAAGAGTAGTTTAGTAKGFEKESGGKTSGEKKYAAERVKRRPEYVELSAAVVDGGAQSVETRETRRVNATGAIETEIVVNVRGEARSEAASGQGGFKTADSFENFLARELQQNLNSDIVRQAQVMLREGGEGTIRLSLKPEFLGKVKIHLEMTENKITGKIVVESGEALRAFEREMQSLEQTFRNEGFDGANLSLELADRDDPRNDEGGQPAAGIEFSARTASSRYDGAVDKVVYFGAAHSAKQINVLI
jgi:flagellar hook-length control protein FliK